MRKYLSSDGLLLTVAGGKLLPKNIAYWISSMDYTDRSILTCEEIQGGLCRLIAGGLIVVEKNAVRVTANGKKILKPFRCFFMGAVDYRLEVRERLKKEEYDPAALPAQVYVSQQTYEEALRLYTNRYEKEIKKLTKNQGVKK